MYTRGPARCSTRRSNLNQIYIQEQCLIPLIVACANVALILSFSNSNKLGIEPPLGSGILSLSSVGRCLFRRRSAMPSNTWAPSSKASVLLNPSATHPSSIPLRHRHHCHRAAVQHRRRIEQMLRQPFDTTDRFKHSGYGVDCIAVFVGFALYDSYRLAHPSRDIRDRLDNERQRPILVGTLNWVLIFVPAKRLTTNHGQ
ncbi:hypothetical protein BDW59DRAFT_138152 [Aspergillus cavernicola]|uniref:Uncharacterized protein n=1 Tax=Aspergillus cavernicola TaxID=176166 RepID=A0ABR4J191_9EURO